MTHKIIMILDQIQSGMGTKDDRMLSLGGKNEPIGPAVMMSPYLKTIDAKIVACLYCGTGTYLENPDEVGRKFSAMITKLKPDVVICGPAFDYHEFAYMSAQVASIINKTTTIPAFTAMSQENTGTIEKYKEELRIVKMPMKGGTGLNSSLKNMCELADAIINQSDTSDLESKYCY